MDLLGRKVMAAGGAALRALGAEIAATVTRARAAGVEGGWCDALSNAFAAVGSLTMELGALGLAGQVEQMMLHSADYLDLFSTMVIGWQWLAQAAAAREGLSAGRGDAGFLEGKLCAAQYWIATELPRIDALAALCRSGEGSYARMKPEWF
ncbi:MAG: acyl-CoA dehydrogenase C-terminal domain-containing protein [Polyangiaceae bacterium]